MNNINIIANNAILVLDWLISLLLVHQTWSNGSWHGNGDLDGLNSPDKAFGGLQQFSVAHDEGDEVLIKYVMLNVMLVEICCLFILIMLGKYRKITLKKNQKVIFCCLQKQCNFSDEIPDAVLPYEIVDCSVYLISILDYVILAFYESRAYVSELSYISS